tara:strand:+ start:2595 stop:2924 length:330 start_codon:yes stop_codon:yes gene_type:complete
MEDYSYMSSGGGMVLLLMVLGALMVYLLFSKGFWMDRFMRSTKWEGDDITPEYNTNQKIDEAISQEKIPYTPSLDIPFDDPEVPNRPSKKKKVVKKPKKKRVYKRRKKK